MIVRAAIMPGILSVDADISGTLPVTAEFVNTIYNSTAEDYTGDYEVTSFCADPLLTTSLVLPTNDKHMLNDVTVFSVPTTEEYNSAGGVTFTIGG